MELTTKFLYSFFRNPHDSTVNLVAFMKSIFPYVVYWGNDVNFWHLKCQMMDPNEGIG